MKKLIEALEIFLKYGNPESPFYCEHDVLCVCGIEPKDVSKEDKDKLEALGFFIDEDGFKSFRYGSC